MKVKEILNWISKHIIALFKHMPGELKNAIHIGVLVTENIKDFVDSPLADIITTIIPGDIDNKIKGWLKIQLPIILIQLKLADSEEDQNQVVLSGIRTLSELNGSVKKAFLHNLSIMVAMAASNDELQWEDGVCLLEWYYQKRYKAGKKG